MQELKLTIIQCLEEVAKDVCTFPDVDFLFKWYKKDFIFEQLAYKLLAKGIDIPAIPF